MVSVAQPSDAKVSVNMERFNEDVVGALCMIIATHKQHGGRIAVKALTRIYSTIA